MALQVPLQGRTRVRFPIAACRAALPCSKLAANRNVAGVRNHGRHIFRPRQGPCRPQRTARALCATSAREAAAAQDESAPCLFTSALSRDPNAGVEEALSKCVRSALEGWPAGRQPQLAFLFVSSSYQRSYEQVLSLLLEKLPSLEHVVGCSVSAGRRAGGLGGSGEPMAVPRQEEQQQMHLVAPRCAVLRWVWMTGAVRAAPSPANQPTPTPS